MAIAITARSATTHNPGTGSWATGSFTPSNDSLLVAFTGLGGNEAGLPAIAPTILDSVGLTWTSRGLNSRNDGGWVYGSRMWTAPVGTGASMTVTCDHGANTVEGSTLLVCDLTGHNVADPIGATATDNNVSDGADSITLSANPASDSVVLACIDVQESSAGTGLTTFGTGWTELQDVNNSGWAHAQSQHRTGSTSTTVGWDDTHTGTSGFFSASAIAIEVKVAAAGGAIPHSPLGKMLCGPMGGPI